MTEKDENLSDQIAPGSNPENKIDDFNDKAERAQIKYKKLIIKKNKKIEARKVRSKNKTDQPQVSLFKKIKNLWPLSKVSGRILLIYFFTVLIGGFLLTVPGVARASRFHWDFLTGIFTASSAFSDTGISITQANTDYSFWGQLILLVLIQLGGIGVLTFKIVLFIIIGKKISISDQSIAQSERGTSILANTVDTVKDGFIFLTSVEIIGATILFFGFYFETPAVGGDLGIVNNPHENFATSFWMAIFHSVSAVNNAGFDIISGHSILPYNVAGHRGYLIQVVFMLQWIIGGLGYPTFHDIKTKIKARREGKSVKFSLFTKLNFFTYLTLFLLGPLLTYFSELVSGVDSRILYMHVMGKAAVKNPWYVSFMDIMFNVTASRNSGFSTVDVNNFNAGSQSILSLWMFIGSAPSSTAGGIRTTTFAICCIATASIMRNKKTVDYNKKRIPDETVKRSFVVFFLSFLVIFSAILIVYLDPQSRFSSNGGSDENYSRSNIELVKILVMICSAFGTVGFSTYNVAAFGILTKLTIIFVMFIGQLGISNTLLAFIKPTTKQRLQYLEEDVVIG